MDSPTACISGFPRIGSRGPRSMISPRAHGTGGAVEAVARGFVRCERASQRDPPRLGRYRDARRGLDRSDADGEVNAGPSHLLDTGRDRRRLADQRRITRSKLADDAIEELAA